MKKKMKLHLNRETLRNLTEGDLKDAVGGAGTIRTCETATCDPSCPCSIPATIFECC